MNFPTFWAHSTPNDVLAWFEDDATIFTHANVFDAEYIADLGLRRYLIPRHHYDLGASIENAVYLELRRRYAEVTIGIVGRTEVGFVARSGDFLHYFRVAVSLIDPSAFERELAPLRAIRDNYPKTILTMDPYSAGNYDGIEVAHVLDWLLQ